MSHNNKTHEQPLLGADTGQDVNIVQQEITNNASRVYR